MIPRKFMMRPPSEGQLSITPANGAEISVVGLDAPERIEGRSINGAVLDEYGNMKPSVWGEHLRPALSDRLGWCDFIGVPEGRNHYYDLYKAGAGGRLRSMVDVHLDERRDSAARRNRSSEADLDELTFNQNTERRSSRSRVERITHSTKACIWGPPNTTRRFL